VTDTDSPYLRKRRYEAKTDGAVVKIQTDSDREERVANYKRAAISQSQLEHIVKGLCKNAATSLTEVYYICFGNEILRIKSKHSGTIVCQEVNLMREKWATRGLNTLVLDNIVQCLAQGCYTAPPVVHSFTFDHSLLDGPDVLI
jgi:hypothetical protein